MFCNCQRQRYSSRSNNLCQMMFIVIFEKPNKIVLIFGQNYLRPYNKILAEAGIVLGES